MARYGSPTQVLSAALQALAEQEADLRPDEVLTGAEFWRFASGTWMRAETQNSWTFKLSFGRLVTGHDYPELGPQTAAQRVALVVEAWEARREPEGQER
jgi:hypothetical protein